MAVFSTTIDATGWAVIITAVFLGIGKIVTMVLDHYKEQARIVREEAVAAKVEEARVQAAKTAVKVEEVKTTLTETSSIADGKLDKIHTLVNSAMGTQLETVAIALRRLAEGNPSKENLEAAKLADEKWSVHKDKQSTVDNKTN